MPQLSPKSLARLEGVDQRLIDIVLQAIEITRQDFFVIEGVRTLERQKQLFVQKATQTLKSKHIDGMAVDLGALVDGKVRWETDYYFPIADAMIAAVKQSNTPIRWGAAWHIEDIGVWDYTAEEAVNEYIATRKAEGKKPFLDFPHFEINE